MTVLNASELVLLIRAIEFFFFVLHDQLQKMLIDHGLSMASKKLF